MRRVCLHAVSVAALALGLVGLAAPAVVAQGLGGSRVGPPRDEGAGRPPQAAPLVPGPRQSVPRGGHGVLEGGPPGSQPEAVPEPPEGGCRYRERKLDLLV